MAPRDVWRILRTEDGRCLQEAVDFTHLAPAVAKWHEVTPILDAGCAHLAACFE
ncbi:hypothetical protein HF896_09605 [Alicycliphilus denitrificans]|uniref:Uncharacterized protein n=1 Tax=Alicycliphilus denitrificans TaxID=179636 RepID=A0A858ZSV9_9BURK|nr:hypothetical protein [Alicycliphilus denitrificans]QKD43847.1 hypothetical protein HF896_09605 [Alicycliphilus denitrificans]